MLAPSVVWGQFQFSYSDSISVTSNNEELEMPWAGGLNYPQFSSIDYDFDGDLDLLVFDRSSNQLKIFTQYEQDGAPHYKYDPEGASYFPQDIRYRLFAIDYDGDGKKDLFAYGIGGLKVYRNTGDNSSGLSWVVSKELLYSDNWGTPLSLYVSSSDIPAIVDVDGDGDLDILTFHIGGEYLRYHQNQSFDLYEHSDSLIFELKNECWGTFREDVSTNSVFLNDDTTPCSGGNVPNPESPIIEAKRDGVIKAHSGSTILALDIDGSGVMDIVLGDVAFSNLNLLINGGDSVNQNSAMVTTDPFFPSNSIPANMTLFPASFNLDVDFDGVKDLIVAPNAKNISENEKSVHFYKNTGTNEVSNFVFQSNDFLQSDMIEHGTGSIPILTDIDGDGLVDLIVANFFAYKAVLNKESRIAYYKNIGTALQPEFTLVDSDFQNLSELNMGLRMFPTFGDLNGDGNKDMLLGLEDGTLAYFENISTGASPVYAAPIINYKDNNNTPIQNGLYAAPQLFDLNKDGLLDLIIGVKTGELVYYQNIGSQFVPSFQLVTTFLGGIDVSDDTPNGYSAPCFFSLNDTTFALIGSIDGKLRFVEGIDGHIADGDLFDSVNEEFLGINVGSYSAAAIADIDTDNHLDLFIGQDLGGLFYLEDNANGNLGLSDTGIDVGVKVWPNPFADVLKIEVIDGKYNETAKLYDVTGKCQATFVLKDKINKVNIKGLNSGVYYLQFSSSQKAIKLIKF